MIGHRTKVKVVKNKLAPPFQLAEFDIRYGLGIDATGDLLDLAVVHGLVDKNGAYYAFSGQSLGQGREKARAALADDGAMRATLHTSVLAAVAGRGGRSGRSGPIRADQPSSAARTSSRNSSSGMSAATSVGNCMVPLLVLSSG